MLTKSMGAPVVWQLWAGEEARAGRRALSFFEVEASLRELAARPLAGSELELLSTSRASDGTEVRLDCAVHAEGADMNAVTSALRAFDPADLGARPDAVLVLQVTTS